MKKKMIMMVTWPRRRMLQYKEEDALEWAHMGEEEKMVRVAAIGDGEDAWP